MKFSWLNGIDKLSYEPRIYINGKDRYITKFGICFSILAAISILVLGLYFLVNFFQKQQINIITYVESTSDPRGISMKGKPLFFRLREVNGGAVDPRYAKISPQYWLKYSDTNITKIDLELRYCKNDFFDAEFLPSLNFNVTDYLCLNTDKYNITIFDNSEKNIHLYLNIYLTTCVNSTENNNSCFQQTAIDDYLTNSAIYYDIVLPNAGVNHFNDTNPVTKQFYRNNVRINYKSKYSYRYTTSKLVYDSDDGIVFENMINAEAYQVSLSSSSTITSFDYKAAFFNVQLLMNEEKTVKYRRTYPKLQTVVASIGGMLNFISSVSGFIVKFVSEKLMMFDISNKVVDYEEEEERNYNKNMKPIVLNLYRNLDNPQIVINLKNCDDSSSPKINDSKITITNALHVKVPTMSPHQKNLTILEAILPRFCFKNNSRVNLIDKCNDTIRILLSAENLLEILSKFEKIQNIIFDENQKIIIQYMKNQNLEYYYNKITNKRPTSTEEIKNIVKDLNEKSDFISQSIIKNLKNGFK